MGVKKECQMVGQMAVGLVERMVFLTDATMALMRADLTGFHWVAD